MSYTTVKGDDDSYFNDYQDSKHDQIMRKVLEDALVKSARHRLSHSIYHHQNIKFWTQTVRVLSPSVRTVLQTC